jgi:hypothetical protein
MDDLNNNGEEKDVDSLIESMFPQAKVADDVEDEPHGPLRSISYNLCSHGMMAGSGSTRNTRLEWLNDKAVILSCSSSGSGANFDSEYRVKPEVAQKLRDLVSEKKLARLSKMDIPTVTMFDNFTSATISMTFDDSGIGGSPYEICTINCGPSGMTFKTLEDEISSLLDECRDTGECTRNEMTGSQNILGNIMGVGVGMPGTPGAVPPAPDTVKSGGWVCSCGTVNTGKFCENCGNSRSVSEEEGTWVCPSCKASGNRGNFCEACGSRGDA